ncbi:MAG TPA: hypothetical protein VKI43_17005 [Vicinamibacterales bacterium]|nr:hypothetical protein [Vicinamibacterales bacterium]
MAEHTPDGHVESHHEESDVNFGAIIGFGAGLIVVAAVVSVIIFGLFRFFDHREGVAMPSEYPLAAAQANRVPPEPRLQVDPRQDLADLRAKEDELLASYGWVDKNAGVVRIPIDAAMKLTLERGLPARQESK